MQRLHVVVIGKEIECDNYTGNDIEHLADLRDQELLQQTRGGLMRNQPIKPPLSSLRFVNAAYGQR